MDYYDHSMRADSPCAEAQGLSDYLELIEKLNICQN
jgi:hypothetical protein